MKAEPYSLRVQPGQLLNQAIGFSAEQNFALWGGHCTQLPCSQATGGNKAKQGMWVG